MGGYGSGRRGCKRKVEHLRSIDVNKMHRAGVFTVGRSGGLHWMVDGEEVASIGYRMEERGLRLNYRRQIYDEDPENVDYVVPIECRPCRYGGSRPYFRCPGIRNGRYCGRTVAKLYCGRYFLCRHCLNLAYASQSEEPRDRLLRKANKKRMRLGGKPGCDEFIQRPKGMWHRTFEREVEAIYEAEELADRHFAWWVLKRFGTTDVGKVLGT